jgi:amino acid transporter
VIGASSWLLPTSALAQAGPGMFIDVFIAVIAGIFLAVTAAYVGSAVLVAGGTCVIARRALSPFGGFRPLVRAARRVFGDRFPGWHLWSSHPRSHRRKVSYVCLPVVPRHNPPNAGTTTSRWTSGRR